MYANISTVAEQVGTRVRQARVHAGLSINDVSRALGINDYSLVAVEQGDLKLAAGQIADLCDLFNKPPSWFFSS